ncbi:hypothetical protein PAECIP111892_04403 [Paenibacillus auburnensis]|uniref:PKD/Chitinase domain-containing protein n=1 Tax=Paenibacillus auburnensis TaxID=2905649 RepID=A0ABM9CM03_9BACL|nr:hypothetical protein [Paenibacillus auburnensis]CAH1217381.1 hypothetical protein PAECIP111892_04403 [Paenibacillus auburnensis]
MKKVSLLLFSLLLVASGLLIQFVSATASYTKSGTVNVPISSGLVGENNGAKAFTLDLPSGVNASSINLSTLKYNGTNAVNSLQISNGKIKLNLTGVTASKRVQVKGLYSGYDQFVTRIGNSIWRYADGRTWQINDYSPSTDMMTKKDLPAPDSAYPSEMVPKVTVNAASNQSTDGRFWKTLNMEPVDEKYVDQNSIDVTITETSDWVKNAYPKGNKIIIAYQIPVTADDKGGWKDVTSTANPPVVYPAMGRFYEAGVKYYYTAFANIPTYSYGGTITFDYTLPTEPTLIGEVNLIKPNPNPTEATGSDIPVVISLKGTLEAYTDTSNIQEWVFYAKESNNDASLQVKKDYLKKLSSTQEFTFYIKKENAAATTFKQEYSLTVTVRFTKPIITPDGTISSLTQSLTSSASTYNGPKPSSGPNPTPPPSTGKPPEARISMPDQVVAGEKFIVSGADSFDPDGTIVKYIWQHPNVDDALYGKSSDTRYGLDSIDTTQTITLTVVDNSGLTATTSRDIKVVAPAPAAKLQVLGTLKENRKITLHNASKNAADDFPMIPGKTKFTISAVSGGTNADIKYSGSLSGTDNADILIKVAGQYKATLYVENTAGYSATKAITFTVQPDQAPVPYISMPNTVYRDPSNGNKASVTIDDLSISPDYDYLAKRVWEYRYDSDNDGNFVEEAWVLMDNGNLDRINFYPAEVGRYEIRITTKEEFGQPTIDEFVTVNDRKSADTATQNVTERIVTVLNRPPLSDWSW